MQLSAKLKNKSTVWSALLKPRVLDVVSNAGNYYQNTSGFNGDLDDTNHWFPIFLVQTGATAITITKAAGDVSGSDPDYQINLDSDGMPAFPTALSVYVSTTGLDADYALVTPVNYDPVNQVLHGMNSPTDFPAQKIKIVAI